MIRVTLDRISSRKMLTQLQKDKWKHIKPHIMGVRTSDAGVGGTVYWDPPKALLEGFIEILTNEQQWARKKESLTWKEAEKTLVRLKAALAETLSESTASGTPVPSE